MSVQNVAASAAVDAAKLFQPWIIVVFTAALVFQFLHLAPIMVATYRHAWLGLDVLHAHAGSFSIISFQWHHFILNTIYWLALLAVLFGSSILKNSKLWHMYPALVVFIVFFSVFETLHMTEHTSIITNYIVRGCLDNGCLGILGRVTDSLYVHSFYNIVIFFVPLYAYFRYGFFRRCREMTHELIS